MQDRTGRLPGIRDKGEGMRGTVVGHEEELDGCDLEGCSGHAVVVDWENGSSSWECSKALKYVGFDAAGYDLVQKRTTTGEG